VKSVFASSRRYCPQKAGLAVKASDAPGVCTFSRRVLVVEDNPECRVALQFYLSRMGHVVEVTADGLQGIQKALAWRPDVVIVDVGLPVLDGYEVARRVRAALADRPLLVALTGYGQPEDRDRAGEAGFDVYLAKPASPEDIAHLVGRPAPSPAGPP
jgi:CheY-like chemotaxis protein